jgi:O-antigen ligase
VPASTYDVRDDPVMKSAMATGFQHAHNVFLNCWLQLGACGLLLYMASLVALVRAAWRARREDAVMRLGGVGALTLLFAMLMRNMTDDFFVYGIASSFWIALGALLGLAAQDPPEIHRSA